MAVLKTFSKLEMPEDICTAFGVLLTCKFNTKFSCHSSLILLYNYYVQKYIYFQIRLNAWK